VIAFVDLPVTGWFWVAALRSSIRKIWGLPEYPGRSGLLLAVSRAVAFTTTALAGRLVDAAGAGRSLCSLDFRGCE